MAAGALLALTLCGVGAVRVCAAPPPLVLLFPSDQNDASDAKALISLRTALRKDGHLEAMSFDPEAPSLLLAASDAQHPEWLSAPVTGDSERLDIARAVGAAFVLVVTHEGRGKADVHLLESGPAARAWTISNESTSDAVGDVERDALSPAPKVVLVSPPYHLGPATLGDPQFSPPQFGHPQSAGVPAQPLTPAPLTPAPLTPAPLTPAPLTPAPLTPAPLTLPAAPDTTAPPIVQPPTVTGNPNISRNAADLAAVQPLIATADRDVQSGDFVDAYALYRQAVNLAPLSDVPRLKLAQAYLLGGQPDLALSEARRALEVVPDSAPVQAFLNHYDKENGTAFGKIVSDQALIVKDPQDPAAHLNLGDALWGQGKDVDAEAEFVQARDLAAPDSLIREKAVAHLAGLHAAMGRYTDALAEMKTSGDLAYPLVLTVAQNVMDDLAGSLDQAQDGYAAGKLTRADLYGRVQAAETGAQALADFVAKISPPAAYAHSHLDRVQAVTLFSQAAAVLTGYLETNDPSQHDKAVQLEKDAQTEMLTAHAAELKLGLWNAATRLGEDSR